MDATQQEVLDIFTRTQALLEGYRRKAQALTRQPAVI